MTWVTKSYEKLSKKKKDNILQAAIHEFAERGYEFANTNRIAEKAGISVGSLFNYFESKVNLFLYVVQFASNLIESYVKDIVDDDNETFIEKMENFLKVILKTSREEVVLLRLYHEMIFSGNAGFLDRIPMDMERFTANAYAKIIHGGQRKGEIRDDIHPLMAAFHIDNIFMALQYAYTCDYEKKRYHIYISPSIDSEIYDDFVIEQTLIFIRGALTHQNAT